MRGLGRPGAASRNGWKMDFSVIIPTYNRSEVLELTLKALATQEPAADPGASLIRYEVVVIDDGSTDSTRQLVETMGDAYPVPLKYLFQPNRKQGAARNLGVSHARGKYLLFLGDDIVPGPVFLSEHRQSHVEGDPMLAVIGYTRWPEHFRRTPFLQYIGEQGWQFGFSLIEDPGDLPFNFFYTSNLSVSRDLFLDSGGFDESFQEYGWEDMELGLRLKKKGMRLAYNARAVAYHHHRINLASFVRRQRRVGQTAWTFYGSHPEVAGFLNVESVPQYSPVRRLKMWVLTRLCSLTENLTWPDMSSFYPDLMSYHYNRGICEGRNESS